MLESPLPKWDKHGANFCFTFGVLKGVEASYLLEV